jgi:hypothetical protein
MMGEAGAHRPPSGELVLPWPVASRHHLPVLWPGMILVAAAVHLLALLLFDLVYPPPQAEDLRQRPLFALAGADLSPATQAWLAAADPAAFSPAHTDEEALGGASVRLFQPAFLREGVPVLEVGEVQPEAGREEFPARPLFFLRNAKDAPMGGPEEQSTAGWNLHWVGHPEGVGLTSEGSGLAAPGTHGGATQPPWFLVGVLPEGIPGLVSLVQSSGDESWDESVAGYLRALRLPPAGGLAWRWHQVTLRPAEPPRSDALSEDFSLPPIVP